MKSSRSNISKITFPFSHKKKIIFPYYSYPIPIPFNPILIVSDLHSRLYVHRVTYKYPRIEYNSNHITYSDYHNKKYLKIVRKYADIIVGQFFGHLHADTARVGWVYIKFTCLFNGYTTTLITFWMWGELKKRGWNRNKIKILL